MIRHKTGYARTAPLHAGHSGHFPKQFSKQFPKHLRVLRAATEIALIVAALVLFGVVMSHPVDRSGWRSQSADGCVRMGRAGEICGRGEAPPKPREDGQCVSLGRAGRYCPPPRS